MKQINSSNDKGDIYIDILNPLAQQKLEWDIIPLVERPTTLEGKTVYIINQRWGGAKAHESLLLSIKEWLEDNIPGTKVVYKVKKGSYAYNDTELWQKAGKKADAVIIGVPH